MAENMDYAGLGSRILAYIVDSILFGVLFIFIGFITAVAAPHMVRSISTILGPVAALLFFGYFVWFEGTSGQTLGKRLANIKVVKNDGTDCNRGSSIIRNLARIVDYLPFLYLIGIIAIAATDENQRVGDLAAKTVVVKE